MGHTRDVTPPKKSVFFFSGKFQLPAPQADFLRCLCMEPIGECGKLETTEFFSQNEPVVTCLDPPCRHILRHMTRLAHDGESV